MKLSDNELSSDEHRFLQRLKTSEVPYWRKPLGHLATSGGILLILLHIVAVIAGFANHIIASPVLFGGATALVSGLVQLQEIRYQRIIKYLLLEQKTI
jgi:hypothetical protein